MHSSEDYAHLSGLQTADLNWLEKTVLADPDRRYEELTPRTLEQLRKGRILALPPCWGRSRSQFRPGTQAKGKR